MDDKNYISSDGGVRFHCCRAANSGSGLMKTIEITKRVVLTALFVMLPWYAYADAGRFPGVQGQLDRLVNADAVVDSSIAAASFEIPTLETIPGQIEMVAEDASQGVSVSGENPQSGIVNQELASLDVAVDVGVSSNIQGSQPAPIVSRDATSLEVIDTGAARHVQNPQPVEVMTPDILETVGHASAPHETGAAPGNDQSARNYELMLPVTDLAKNSKETGKKNRQAKDVSGSTASNEIVDLPYAVLLVILALMSMIPIARRNG